MNVFRSSSTLVVAVEVTIGATAAGGSFTAFLIGVEVVVWTPRAIRCCIGVGDGDRRCSSKGDGARLEAIGGDVTVDVVFSYRLGDGLGLRLTGETGRFGSPAPIPAPDPVRTVKDDPYVDFEGDDVGEMRGNRRLADVGDDTDAESLVLVLLTPALDFAVIDFSLAGFAGSGGLFVSRSCCV